MMNSENIEVLRKYINNIKDKLKNNNLIYILIGVIIIGSSTLLIYNNDKDVHATKEDNSPKYIQKSLEVEDNSIYKSSLRKSLSNSIELNLSNGLRELRKIQNDVDTILSVELKAYAIDANGKILATLKTKDEAQSILDSLVKPYVTEEEEENIEKIDFREKVKVIETITDIDGFDDYEKALHYISKGTNETKIHKIEKGENFWVLADNYNIKVDDLLKANPDVSPEKIQIGQEVSLVVPKPFITVVTTEKKEYTEYIPYETENKDTNVLYKGEYRIEKNGEKGEREVVARIYKENGIEVEREILEENILKQPVTKVVLNGTKNPPPKIGTGSFSRPSNRGSITSPFGSRWGRMHTGIDIGMPTGTTVKAADGGKVIYSGWKGAYGYLVIIDHGANMQTYYAHNSKLLVKKGEKVFKGQTIAKSGSTGRSTGPHLHFEVRKNGTPLNPTKYVNY